MFLDNGGPRLSVDQAVLFSFDDRSMPLRYRLQVGLVPETNPYKPHTRVLAHGKPGDPDGAWLTYYGSVIRVGDELRMWYLGRGQDGGSRVCYAVSKDGVHWEKPSLGLMEYAGSTENNLVGLAGTDVTAICVLHEPEDPDPGRRFKLAYETTPFWIGAAFSPDGLRWVDSPHNPILKHNAIEPTGLLKFDGCYYLNGQGGNVGTKRALVTYLSYDFDHWTDAVALGLRRDIAPYPQAPGPHAGEQVHLGAGLWYRGNVILGLYGQWHGNSNDRSRTTMDLGFVVSHDAMHFVEPIPDFQMISAYEVLGPSPQEMPPGPCLEQGQGFENLGDETLIWYSPWRGGFVCVARWPRDRLGYFEVVRDPRPRTLFPEDTHALAHRVHTSGIPEPAEPHCISCPILLEGPARVWVNAGDLGEQSYLKVEVLDRQFRLLPGYSGDQCTPLTQGGLREPVSWAGCQVIEAQDHPIRIKVSWEGDRPEDAYLYAIYVEQVQPSS